MLFLITKYQHPEVINNSVSLHIKYSSCSVLCCKPDEEPQGLEVATKKFPVKRVCVCVYMYVFNTHFFIFLAAQEKRFYGSVWDCGKNESSPERGSLPYMMMKGPALSNVSCCCLERGIGVQSCAKCNFL